MFTIIHVLIIMIRTLSGHAETDHRVIHIVVCANRLVSVML